MKWYDDYDHIGYDLDGKKIAKPAGFGESDNLDEFLNKMQDPDYWRTVKDRQTGGKIVLSQEDIDIIKRLMSGKYGRDGVNDFETAPVFTQDEEKMALSGRPEHKRSFIPSKWEKLQVGKYVDAIKKGLIKPRLKVEKNVDEKEPEFYDLWGQENDDEKYVFPKHSISIYISTNVLPYHQKLLNFDKTFCSRMKCIFFQFVQFILRSRRHMQNLPAPKLPLPDHNESYNPPPEYLFDEEELAKWNRQEKEDRRINFIPKKFSALRVVPAYADFIKERFERCLDMYLAPRQRKMRVQVDAKSLIPELPKPKDLQPFPHTLSIVFKGHHSLIHSMSVHHSGQWLLSASNDKSVKVWEVATGRCMRTWKFDEKCAFVNWLPSTTMTLFSVAL